MTLDELPSTSRAVVTHLDARGAERRRLMDLGLLPGVEVTVGRSSAMGDPKSYRILGALIALRRGQARGVHVDVVGAP